MKRLQSFLKHNIVFKSFMSTCENARVMHGAFLLLKLPNVALSNNYGDLSDVMSTCQIILSLYVLHYLGKNTFLRFRLYQINNDKLT